MLALAGAAGGLALTGKISGAWSAQAAGKIEQMDPALANIIATNEPIRQLGTGYGGDIGPAEGPVWIKEGRYLLLTTSSTRAA